MREAGGQLFDPEYGGEIFLRNIMFCVCSIELQFNNRRRDNVKSNIYCYLRMHLDVAKENHGEFRPVLPNATERYD
jgi:hypothetical protein